MFRFFKHLFRHRLPMMQITQSDGTILLIPYHSIQAVHEYKTKTGKTGTEIITAVGRFRTSDSLDKFRKELGYLLVGLKIKKKIVY